ncbi:MAG TPA: hypothetical protein DDX92_01895 [Flavobacteriales bacterium]|nr:hypothetical protein [Flavobacteriales bacterium]
MDRGVLSIETDYSDSDFKIEWEGITQIYTETVFIITLSNGERYYGPLKSENDSSIQIIDSEGTVLIPITEVVHLTSVEQGFWSRLSLEIDFGFSFAKANNMQQYSTRSYIGYTTQKWMLDGSYNQVRTSQDSVETIQRTDATFNFTYIFPKDWYAKAGISFLSNTEQKLDLRTTGKLGIGNYLIHSNSSYWAFEGGAAYNNENFAGESDDRQSFEGYLGTELNMYDAGDLSLLTKLYVYPSITESGRVRADFNFDIKYDLPKDLYIRLGYSLNYDNQPIEGGSDTDYTLQTGIGWSL